MKIEVYSKPECPLCDKAIAMIADYGDRFDIELQITDITQNQALFEQYCFDIPVVVINGQVQFRGIVDPKKLLSALRGARDGS